jgi:hypothetical protein
MQSGYDEPPAQDARGQLGNHRENPRTLGPALIPADYDEAHRLN